MKNLILSMLVFTASGIALSVEFSHRDLSDAVRKKNVKLVGKIVKQDIDPNQKIPTYDLENGILLNQYEPPLNVLAKKPFDNTSKEIIDQLFNAGATIEGNVGSNGNTTLHIAAEQNNINLLKYIKEKIPNVNLKVCNNYNETPEILATELGHENFAEHLKFDSQTEIDEDRKRREKKTKTFKEQSKKEIFYEVYDYFP